MGENVKKRRNERLGYVVSDAADKTITVQVSYSVRHKRYGKFIRRSTICRTHDEQNQAKKGDKVRIYECRPMSKTKRWMLAEVVTRQVQPDEVQV